MILASCYTLGIQRFDLAGRNEGPITWAARSSHAVPDFPGRTIAAATLEGELAVMNSAGNVRWRTELPRPVIALEIDPLGRYVDLRPRHRRDRPPRPLRRREARIGPPGAAGRGGRRRRARRCGPSTGGVARRPTGSSRSVETDQQAETAVLAVVDDPPLIALFTSPHRLQLFDTAGQKLGQAPD